MLRRGERGLLRESLRHEWELPHPYCLLPLRTSGATLRPGVLCCGLQVRSKSEALLPELLRFLAVSGKDASYLLVIR